MMILDNKFELGQTVYLITDKDQLPRIVTSMQIRPNCISYELSCGSAASWHYDFEISIETNVLLTSTN